MTYSILKIYVFLVINSTQLIRVDRRDPLIMPGHVERSTCSNIYYRYLHTNLENESKLRKLRF